MDSQTNFDEKNYIARNYRIIREFRSKTGDAVVKGTGISKQNVSAWENLKVNPGKNFIDRLALFFDLPSEVFYVKALTKEYLEKNFSTQNNTSVDKAGDNNRKVDHDIDEVFRHLMEGNSQYILINKELILEKYRLVSVEKMEEEKRESERKHQEILKDLEDRKNQIHGLYKLISEITSKIPNPGSSEIPEFNKA